MNKNEIPELPAIGKNVHKERRNQGLSLELLAQSSGVSKAMLSQIESGKVNPTIATMWKIAHALNVDFELMLQGESGHAHTFEVTRAEQVSKFSTDHGKTLFQVYSPVRLAENLEIYQVTLAPGSTHYSQPHSHGAEEFITVLSGEVEVAAEKNKVRLHEGDFITYEADVTHSLTNHSKTPAQLSMIVRFEKRS